MGCAPDSIVGNVESDSDCPCFDAEILEAFSHAEAKSMRAWRSSSEAGAPGETLLTGVV